MANGKIGLGKGRLLSSTALTKHAATVGALGLVFGASSAYALDPNALPTDPNVVGGGATFNTSGSTLTVNQSTNRTVIDWRSFDIGSNATTNFVQPGASSIAVNRVNSSANPTEIQGTLNANGQVWILNPNGVMFGKNAKIDVAGIVASTGNINTAAFMRGDNRLNFSGADGGSVSNEGSITVADGGLAAFVAPSVRNSGVIRARVGKVTLAAGTTFTLDLAGDQLVELGLGANNALVDQSGQVLADGSVVNITAKAASAVVDSVVNVSGTVMASGVHEEGGKIVLTADNVTTTGDAVLAADGGETGNGGSIYSYADKIGSYDGSFSAKGGANAGDGGKIETSGKKVQIAENISVNTLANHGATGEWTIDPVNLVVGSSGTGALSGGTNDEESTISAATVVAGLNSTNVNLQATDSITVNEAITSTATGAGKGNLALNDQDGGGLEINLNAKITLGAGKTLSGQGTTVNVGGDGSIQNGVDVAKAGGATVNVAAGDYQAGTTVNKNGLTLAGADGAKVTVGVGQTGVTINANDVTLTGFEIAGPVVGDQATLDWNSAGNSWGVRVENKSNSNVTISDNNIHDVRTGILITNAGANGSQATTLEDAASGTIADNRIENTKGGILVQYRDGHTFDIHGNSEGENGNEWGIVTGLQNTKIASDPSLARQQQILDWSTDNNGMTVLDRQYATANRSAVTVDATGTATAADDFGLGNGVGNERQPINNIAEGIKAVVAGGTVNVNDGIYTIPSGGANYLRIDKSLNLIGESEDGVIIDAHAASSYGLRIIGGTSDVTLSNFTLYGVTATNGYGVKVEDSQNVSIDHVTSQGAYKAQFDLNGVRGGSLDHVTADGSASIHGGGSVKGAAIAITDSQDITVTNSSTNDGSYGGLAIYQSNKPTGYTYQVDNIVIDGSNSFAETNAVYMEDESASNDFGTVTVEGFDYVAHNTNAADFYSWFQTSIEGAANILQATGNLVSGYVNGWTGSASDGDLYVGHTTGGDAMSIVAAVKAATTGATVNLGAGDFALGTGQLNVNKGLTLAGEGEGVTNISTTSNGYGMFVTGDNVTLSGFTFAANPAGTFAIKVQPDTGVSSDRLLNFAIDHVTINGSKKTALDLNAVVGATIDHVTVNNTTNGNGIALTDSANVTITNVTTSGNAWGGLALYQANGYYDQQVDNISVDESNSFGESNPVYLEDQSASLDFGALTISGFDYAAHNTDAGDFYSWLQTSVEGAANQLQAKGLLTVGYVNGWTGSTSDSDLYVGHTTGGDAMSIAAAINAAAVEATVNVGAGDFALGTGQLNINKGLTLAGEGEGVTNISTTSAGYGIAVTGDDVTLTGFTFNANPSGSYAIKVYPDTGVASDRLLNFAISDVTINGAKRTGLDLNGVVGATIDNVTVNNTTNGNGIALTDSANVTITNVVTSGNAWGGLALYQNNSTYDQQMNNIVVDESNSFGESNPVYLEDESASLDFGALTISGFGYAAHNTDAGDFYSWLQTSLEGAANQLQAKGELAAGYVTGWTGSASDDTFHVGHTTGGDAMSINAAVANSATGNAINVASGTYGEDVVVTGARNIAFNGSTIDSFTQNVASSIGGTATAAGGFVLNGLTTLLSNTVLNGAVTADAINGGSSTLAVNGGATVLNGATYNAAALSFNGASTTLTAANTAFNTAASNGGITFTGPIFGTTDGAQSLSFNAGTAGDISIQNAGTNALWLGDMSVTGRNFSAASVYVNSYTSSLTGNQTFTSTTLNTHGTVNSSVAGNANGPINSGGNVNVTTGGSFNGNVNAPNTTVTGQTITGTFTGNSATFNAGSSVNVTTNVNTVVVNSPSGTVNGTFSTLDSTGGPIVVNGQTVQGDVGTNPNQIVVEGFTLPAGAIVNANGEIVLPNGMLIGLVSPAAGPGAEGGKPKVIIVHSVYRLGELLAQGYVAIIVDMNGNPDDEQELALN